MVNTPVLLIAFNRPEMLQKVVDALSVIRFAKLYAFVDGPRENNSDDLVKIGECKKIIETIDFSNEVIKLYSTKNLGCGGGPFYAITKVFEKETSSIILEDDCVPGQSFFGFCEELLLRYQNEEKVWMISGHNFSWNYNKSENSYLYSGYFHTGGWATWRRSWEMVDLRTEHYNSRVEWILSKRFSKLRERNFFLDEIRFNLNRPDYSGWDYQTALTFWENEGLSIIPLKNLVSNIGISGTHFSGDDRPFFNVSVDEYFKILNHPLKIERDIEYDDFHFKNHWIKAYKRPLGKRIFSYLRKRVKRLIDYSLF